MNKLIKIIIVAFMTALVWSSITNAQQIEDEMRKISIKLKKDNSYLNLKYMTFKPDTSLMNDLNDIPRTNNRDPFSFATDKNTEYRIVFLNG